jgi:hypothetical protein
VPNRPSGPDAPRLRQASISVTQQLVDDVVAAGGSLRVPRRRYYERDGLDYGRRAQLAEAMARCRKANVLRYAWRHRMS